MPRVPAVVSIRPHQIALGRTPPSEATGLNVLTGSVIRASYLGDTVDYQIRLDGSDVVLRVTGPAPARARAGESVAVTVPPEACVLLPAD
jgi:ABC-type Fe3+/spermidine/putrescine transport system ATPase subunit